MQKRVEWVDIAKGIGIILVIIGHCVMLGGHVHNWIFSFHMPLFFILSGLFLVKEELGGFIQKKIKTLLIPYITFFAIGLFFTICIPSWFEKLTLKGVIKDIYFGDPNNVNVSSIWFLVCLFFTMLFLQLILRFQMIVRLIIITFAFVCGLFFAKYAAHIPFALQGRLPLNLDVTFISLVFLSIGYFGKNTLFNMAEWIHKQTKKMNFLYSIFLFGVSVLLSILNHRVNLHGLLFNNPVLYLLESIVGSIFVIYVSCFISKVGLFKRSLKWIGTQSLKILGVQAICIRLYITLVNFVEKKQYSLYFLPPMHAFFSLIFVLAMSVGCVWVFVQISGRVSGRAGK